MGNDMLADLRESCRLLSVPVARWHQVPGLARLFETLAALRLAEQGVPGSNPGAPTDGRCGPPMT